MRSPGSNVLALYHSHLLLRSTSINIRVSFSAHGASETLDLCRVDRSNRCEWYKASTFEPGDRIKSLTMIKDTHTGDVLTVPIGAKGTVVGVDDDGTVRTIFDKTNIGMRASPEDITKIEEGSGCFKKEVIWLRATEAHLSEGVDVVFDLSGHGRACYVRRAWNAAR